MKWLNDFASNLIGSLRIAAVLCILAAPCVYSQQAQPNPFGLYDSAARLSRSIGLANIEKYIESHWSEKDHPDASLTPYEHCFIAELLKYAGDGPRAERQYKEAIATAAARSDPYEAAYELFYADYLRNNRGPGRPLLQDAEKHYISAIQKLEKRQSKSLPSDQEAASVFRETESRIERSMVSLYQQDGFPVYPGRLSGGDSTGPSISLATIDRYATSLAPFDEVDDVRLLTADALFAENKSAPPNGRLGRALSPDELRGIIQSRNEFQTLDRITIRDGDWPAVDFFYEHEEDHDGSITNYFEPDKFNDVRLDEYGTSISRAFDLFHSFDLYLSGGYSRISRVGTIEFFPNAFEHLNQYQATAAISHFLGPDKITAEFDYVYQNLNPQVIDPFRDLEIAAARLDYLILRPLPFITQPGGRYFQLRGLDLFTGVALEGERYGPVDEKHNDYFAGATARGIGPFNLTVQPTVFTAGVGYDHTQSNAQYRTNLLLEYRIIDEEREPSIPNSKPIFGLYPAFLHLVFPFSEDNAMQGPNSYENFKIGIGLDSQLFRRPFAPPVTGDSASPTYRGTSIFASIHYDYQRFYNLNKNESQVSLSLGVGF